MSPHRCDRNHRIRESVQTGTFQSGACRNRAEREPRLIGSGPIKSSRPSRLRSVETRFAKTRLAGSRSVKLWPDRTSGGRTWVDQSSVALAWACRNRVSKCGPARSRPIKWRSPWLRGLRDQRGACQRGAVPGRSDSTASIRSRDVGFSVKSSVGPGVSRRGAAGRLKGGRSLPGFFHAGLLSADLADKRSARRLAAIVRALRPVCLRVVCRRTGRVSPVAPSAGRAGGRAAWSLALPRAGRPRSRPWRTEFTCSSSRAAGSRTESLSRRPSRPKRLVLPKRRSGPELAGTSSRRRSLLKFASLKRLCRSRGFKRLARPRTAGLGRHGRQLGVGQVAAAHFLRFGRAQFALGRESQRREL